MKTHDVTVGENKFRISLFEDLRDSSRYKNIVVAAAAKAQREARLSERENSGAEELPQDVEQAARDVVALFWALAASAMPVGDYKLIQDACLRVCSLYIGEDALPVMLKNGVIDAAVDAVTLDALILEALQFNLCPFFVAASKRSTNSATSPVSTP